MNQKGSHLSEMIRRFCQNHLELKTGGHMTTLNENILKATPRIALLISDPEIRSEVASILSSKYSSFLLITDKEKLKEFDTPLILIVDSIADAAAIREQHPMDGTQVLVISTTPDSEINSAAFEAGGSDVLTHPFDKKDIIEKLEKYLKPFRA